MLLDMGLKGVTKKEAQFILKAAAAGGSVGDNRKRPRIHFLIY